MLYCPNKTNILREKSCTVPIRPQKPIFFSLPDLPAKKMGFIGTVQHFSKPRSRKCCTVPIKPIFLADALGRLKKIGFWFYWDSTALFTKKIGCTGTVQHFLRPRGRKCCTVPMKPIFLTGRPGRLKKIGFLRSYWNSTALFTKKIGFIGTVQHFLKPRGRKCCTVPIKPIFLAGRPGRLKKIVIFWSYWDSTGLFA